MFTISEFAVACNTTVKTIRYYDAKGLLKPDYVSPKNGYRYYKRSSVTKYLRIAAMKEAGFTLRETAQCLSEMDDSAFLAMLDQKMSLLEKQLKLCGEYRDEYERSIRKDHRYRVRIDKTKGSILFSREDHLSFFAPPDIIDEVAEEMAFFLNEGQEYAVGIDFASVKTALDGGFIAGRHLAHLQELDTEEINAIQLPDSFREIKCCIINFVFPPDTELAEAIPVMSGYMELVEDTSRLSSDDILFTFSLEDDKSGVTIKSIAIQ